MRKEYLTVQEKKQKLAAVADGPYEVMEANNNTVVLKIHGKHERVSWDRVAE